MNSYTVKMESDKQSFGLTSRIYVSCPFSKQPLSAMFRKVKAELSSYRDRDRPKMGLHMWI